jgi:acetyl/propionyl-CoA carboxylase alpha subunit
MITGIDIVKEQFKIAFGQKLSFSQEDISINGASIECRISAEDPENNFAPSTGQITKLNQPGGPGVRVESGVYEGFTVPIYYDPLIAKLLVWAPTRIEAINRMKRALREYVIRGIKTSIPFHRLVMDNEKFVKGLYDTTFIDAVLGKIEYPKKLQEIAAVSSVIGKLLNEGKVANVQTTHQGISPWKLAARQAMMRSK